MKKQIWLLSLLFLCWLFPPVFCPAAQPEVNFVDIDTLKDMLGDPGLLIIDSRHGSEWTKSNQKIKGAIRLSPETIASWGTQLPKNRKIVLYCS